MALINLTTDMTEPEERAAQNSNNNYLLKIAGGSPRGVYTSLSALNAAHPNGADGIYVVSSNGNWYYWSGTAWVSGGIYQATAIADSSVTSSKIASNAVTSSKIANGAVTPSKLAADVVADINSKISVTPIGTDINIDNLYGTSNHGVYYVKGAGGTKPEGEIQGIVWVYDDGGSWTRQIWLGNRCHTRLNRSTSSANWDPWSNVGPEYTTAEKTKLTGIEAGAQVNKIEQILLNGVAQSISGKSVDIQALPLHNTDENTPYFSDLDNLTDDGIYPIQSSPLPANRPPNETVGGVLITLTNFETSEQRQVWIGTVIATRTWNHGEDHWYDWQTSHLLYDGYTNNLDNLNERKHCGFYSLSEYYPVAGRPAGENGGILAVSYDSESYGVWQTFIGKKIWRRHHDNNGWSDWQTDTMIKTMTQAEYDALTEYDPNTVYIVGD